MAERRPWTNDQDLILQKLYEIDGITKWSQISRLMEHEHNIPGRSGKQCRERYHNHLKGGIRRDKWTPEEEELLVQLHAEYGNRWSYISKLIEGRPQNCVKNMLYSKMRKSVRQLNRFSYINFKRTLKPIKLSFVNRLIDITQTAYKRTSRERSPLQQNAVEIKNNILMLQLDNMNDLSSENHDQATNLIHQIHNFKKDNQKYQRGVTLTKIKKLKQKKKEQEEQKSLEEEGFTRQDLNKKKKKNTRVKRVKVETVETSCLPVTPTSKEEQCRDIIKEELEENIINDRPICSTPANFETLLDDNQMRQAKHSSLLADSTVMDILPIMEMDDLQNPIGAGCGQMNTTPTPYARGYQADWTNPYRFWTSPDL